MVRDIGREDYVFSRRSRLLAAAYALLTVPLAAGLAAGVTGQRAYLTAWVATGALYALPALAVAPRALRLVVTDRTPLYLWYAGWLVLYLGEVAVYLAGTRGWDTGRELLLPAAGVGIAAFAVANALALRGRSGQRALVIDQLDLLVATVAVAGPVALLVAEPVVTSPGAWLAVPAAAVAVGALHALGTYALMYTRLPAGHRRNVGHRLVFCAIVLAAAAGQAAQAASGFRLPAAPLIAVHALCMGGSISVATQTLRATPAGLGRFPPQRQVRKNGLLAALVGLSVASVVAVAAARHDEGWVVATALGLLATLAVGCAVRQALLGPETARLYGQVERAAQERHELLTEVMRYLDSDRPRAAAKLHQQAAVLYTATAWPTVAGTEDAFRQLRSDLARRVDASRQAVTAIGGTVDEAHGLDALAALTRAYVSTLYGDDRPPRLTFTVADGLALDWMDEVLAFRIIQLAVHNVWRHADASAIEVTLAEEHHALTLEVEDDGTGCDPGALAPGRGLQAMSALAELADGHVTLDGAPGGGARLRAVLGAGAGPPGNSEARRPPLRLVT